MFFVSGISQTYETIKDYPHKVTIQLTKQPLGDEVVRGTTLYVNSDNQVPMELTGRYDLWNRMQAESYPGCRLPHWTHRPISRWWTGTLKTKQSPPATNSQKQLEHNVEAKTEPFIWHPFSTQPWRDHPNQPLFEGEKSWRGCGCWSFVEKDGLKNKGCFFKFASGRDDTRPKGTRLHLWERVVLPPQLQETVSTSPWHINSLAPGEMWL